MVSRNTYLWYNFLYIYLIKGLEVEMFVVTYGVHYANAVSTCNSLVNQ